jgi:hypothetical protein
MPGRREQARVLWRLNVVLATQDRPHRLGRHDPSQVVWAAEDPSRLPGGGRQHGMDVVRRRGPDAARVDVGRDRRSRRRARESVGVMSSRTFGRVATGSMAPPDGADLEPLTVRCSADGRREEGFDVGTLSMTPPVDVPDYVIPEPTNVEEAFFPGGDVPGSGDDVVLR